MLMSSLLDRYRIDHGFTTKADEVFPKDLWTVRQVHGDRIYSVKEERRAEEIEPPGYDALIVARSGIPIGVKTADCLPILIADLSGKRVAAVHAGWRGTLARIAEKAIDQFVVAGSKPEDLLAVLGPCMSGACYEVGEDVQTLFQKEFSEFPILKKKSSDKWLLDVRETNRQQILGRGVIEKNIDSLDLCTHCRPDLFPSYRRDGASAGRMISFITL